MDDCSSARVDDGTFGPLLGRNGRDAAENEPWSLATAAAQVVWPQNHGADAGGAEVLGGAGIYELNRVLRPRGGRERRLVRFCEAIYVGREVWI